MKYPIDSEACIRAMELIDEAAPFSEEQRAGAAMALQRINAAYEAGISGREPDFELLSADEAEEKAARDAAAWHGPQKHQLVHFAISISLWENEAYRQGQHDAGAAGGER